MLLKLGIRVCKRTIQKHMDSVRPPRGGGQDWSTFLHNHMDQTWARDFLQTHDLLFRPMFVFVVIELHTRRVLHASITRSPSDTWTAQQLRNALFDHAAPRFLIRDNDNRFGRRFQTVADDEGMELLRTPVRAPRANVFCERFLGSLRRECLDHILILSEDHLPEPWPSTFSTTTRAGPIKGWGRRSRWRLACRESRRAIARCRSRRSSVVYTTITVAPRSSGQERSGPCPRSLVRPGMP